MKYSYVLLTWLLTISTHFSYLHSEGEYLLTPEEAIAVTLENQRLILISDMEILVQAGLLQQLAGPFDYVFFDQFDHTRLEHWINISALTHFKTATEINHTNFGVRKKSRLGTLFTFTTDILQTHNPSIANQANRRSDLSVLTFTVEQPILRDFRTGLDAMREQAQNSQLRATEWTNLQVVADAIFNTTRAYWDWIAAQQQVEIQIKSQNRLQKLVDKTQELIDKEQLAHNEILQPTAQLDTQLSTVAISNQTAYDRLEDLKFAMGIIATGADICNDLNFKGIEIPPYNSDKKLVSEFTQRWPCWSVGMRYDLKASWWQTQVAEELLIGAQNNAEYQLNVFGTVTSTDFKLLDKAKSFFRTLEQGHPQVGWTIGVRAQVPFYNDDATGLLNQRIAQRLQAIYRYQLLTQSALRDIRSASKRYLALIDEVKYAEEAVKNYQLLVNNSLRMLEEGLITVFVSTQYESFLTTAESTKVELVRQLMQTILNIRYLTATLFFIDPLSCKIMLEDVTTLPLYPDLCVNPIDEGPYG